MASAKNTLNRKFPVSIAQPHRFKWRTISPCTTFPAKKQNHWNRPPLTPEAAFKANPVWDSLLEVHSIIGRQLRGNAWDIQARSGIHHQLDPTEWPCTIEIAWVDLGRTYPGSYKQEILANRGQKGRSRSTGAIQSCTASVEYGVTVKCHTHGWPQQYYMQLINIRDVEVSTRALVSHAMPLKAYSGKGGVLRP